MSTFGSRFPWHFLEIDKFLGTRIEVDWVFQSCTTRSCRVIDVAATVTKLSSLLTFLNVLDAFQCQFSFRQLTERLSDDEIRAFLHGPLDLLL